MGHILDMLTAKPKGLRREPQYRPAIGERCRVSGPNSDNEDGYTWTEVTLLWANDIFILYGETGFYPNLYRWEHVLFEPLPGQPAAPAAPTKTFTTEEAIKIAKAACVQGFHDLSIDDLLDETAFDAEMGERIAAAFEMAEQNPTIPAGIFWSREAGNFYSESTRHGMGVDFYEKWQFRKDEFPEKVTGAPGLDINMNGLIPEPQSPIAAELQGIRDDIAEIIG